jgi:ankyrin repeat protein
VEKLLMLGALTDSADIDNMTPLHYTVRFGRQDIAELLLRNGVSVDTAVQRKTWDLKRYEDRNAYEPRGENESSIAENRCARGLTPLHYAALVANGRMVQFFLDHGADPNALSHYDETPLHLALSRGLHGTKCADDWTADHWKAEVLLDTIDFEDEDAYEAAYNEVVKQRMAVIDALLSHSETDVNVQDIEGASALHCAPYEKRECALILRKLIERGADVSACSSKKRTALRLASSQDGSSMVSLLLSRTPDLSFEDRDGLNALHYAARSGNVETITEVLRACETHALDLSTARDKKGRNALHHVLSRADIEALQLLLDRGADVNATDIDGNTPLAFYLSRSWFSVDDNVCRLLLQEGTDPAFVNHKGLTLAHLYANCIPMKVSTLKSLMELGVDMSVTDLEGRTLLHHIALNGSLTEDVLKFLLDETTLRTDKRDSAGKTPVQCAYEQAEKTRSTDAFDSERWARTLEIFLKYKSRIRAASGLNIKTSRGLQG